MSSTFAKTSPMIRATKIFAGIVFGSSLGVAIIIVHGDLAPVPDADQRMTDKRFNFELRAGMRRDAQFRISNIIIYPGRQGVTLVRFDYSNSVGPRNTRYLYANRPYHSRSDDNTIESYLAELGVPYSYAWWAEPRWTYMLAAGMGALLFSGVAGLFCSKRQEVNTTPTHSVSAGGQVTPKAPLDPEKLKEFEDALAVKAAQLHIADDSSAQQPSPAEVLVAIPQDQELAGPSKPPEDDRQVKGEYYPYLVPAKHEKNSGFTLIELLVVVSIITVLASLTIPAIGLIKESAKTSVCGANLRSIGQGMELYLAENQGTYPAAYLYVGHQIEDGKQTPEWPSKGYVHWSSYLYGENKTPAKAFLCPSMSRGGLPPTNTTSDNLDPNQINDVPGVVDQQAPRLAYTVNESICPRNKFFSGSEGFQKAQRAYRFVKVTEISSPATTILGTEFIPNAGIIGGTEDKDHVMSHRPLHGFVGTGNQLNMYKLAPGMSYRCATRANLDADPSTMSSEDSKTRLDWVGRNHGRRIGYPDLRISNFLYVDGHVEAKSVYQTLTPWEWGETFYSLVPNTDLKVP